MEWSKVVDFIQENWLWLLIGGLVVLGVISFIRTLLSTCLMLLLMVLVLTWAYHTYIPQDGVEPPTFAAATSDTVLDYLQNAKGVNSSIDKKGNYEIKNRVVTVSGNIKNSKMRIEVLGQSRYVPVKSGVKEQLERIARSTK